MQARMNNPATLLPGVMEAIQSLIKAAHQGGVPERTLELVHLRTSQINGCAACVDYGVRTAKKSGETDERLATTAVWREAPYFTDAERAALALAESATRLADHPGAVPDEIWDEAAEHYDEEELAALVLWIGVTNMFNRVNVTLRVPAGTNF
ncbi:carboxymuconolactone decarboxylase family protein [Saccharopolyspora erythraea]|uniref:carboxymuconolactone decarboxylase family protein n=1 Tax=Saccharopolyspora erythraea TaxID=1836 RepID=UPI001BA675D5|nr:carboxymuconolactone decarboxylase family protein [Saccharopolyspora erythraea]QUH01487.1 carboxymuconolactone decarboxylase family protein [Saccharopolyspora erythraea]